jgi:hypothetical protein
MFGFRGNNTRRNKVHSHAKKKKSANAKSQNSNQSHLGGGGRTNIAVRQFTPDETTEADHVFDENRSVDMSLYTTRSKATVRYPPRLLNHSYDYEDDDSDDGISHAPTEFTTEIAMKRYARLGGSWVPPSPLQSSSPPPIEPVSSSSSPEQSFEEKPSQLTPTTDLDDSFDVSSESSECGATVYSILPATANMARFAFRDSTALPQSSGRTSKTPLIRNVLSTEANASTTGTDDDEAPTNTASPPKSRRVRASHGPIDLDESVADSSSVGASSSNNSRAASPSGLASPRLYQSSIPASKLDLAKLSSNAEGEYPSRRVVSPTKTLRKDDDTYGFSVAEESLTSHAMSSPNEHRSLRQEENPGFVSVSSATAHSWLHQPQQESVEDFRDDDTYGFSIHSSAQKSIGTTQSGISPCRQVRRVQLFKQWEEDSHKPSLASSILSKSRAITRPIQQRNDEQSRPKSSTASHLDTQKTDAVISKQVALNKAVSTSPKKRLNPKEQPSLSSPHRSPATTKGRKAGRNTKEDDSLEQSIASSLSKPRVARRSKRDKSVPPVKAQAQKVESSPSPLQLQGRPELKGSPEKFPRPPSQTNLSRQPVEPEAIEDFVSSSPPATSIGRHQDRASRVLGAVGKHPAIPPIAPGETGKNYQSPSLVVDRDLCGLTVVSALTTPAAVEPLDDDTYGFSTTSPAPIPPVQDGIFREEEEGDYVWTDQQGERDEDNHEIVTPKNVRRDILDRSYQQTMDAISFARRSNDSQRVVDCDEDEKVDILHSPGIVLLTESELQRHLTKVEKVQPLPSSSIEGYDTWKRQKELQHRYFAKLQANANQRQKERKAKTDRRQLTEGQRSSHQVDRRQHTVQPGIQPNKYSFEDKCMDSTRSAMDRSMDSSIPTVDDGKMKRRRERESGRRRGWGWFQSGRKGEKKNKNKSANKSKKSASSKQAKKEHKKPEVEIVPLSQFMRISADEPAEVAEFSLAPLHKDGVLTLGTSTLPDDTDTLAATKSHNLESTGIGARRMVVHFLEEERDKQRQAELDRSKREKAEQDRIAKRRQEAIEKQRQLNLGDDRCPSEDRNASSQNMSLPKTLWADDSVVDKSICVSSKHSVDSSMKSGSGQILSPCVICKAAERSHISMPCMHFYFCGSCADKLCQSKRPICPVCSTADVAFTRVYTG